MRKLIISLLTATAFVFAFTAPMAKAENCLPIQKQTAAGSFTGSLCMTGPGAFTLQGIAVSATTQQSYNVSGALTISGSYPNLTVSGQVTVTGGAGATVETASITSSGTNVLVVLQGVINKLITLAIPQ